MALSLRRTAASPAYRDWLDYVIVEDGRDVGRLYEDRHSLPVLVLVDPGGRQRGGLNWKTVE